jgi:hypothetical protein
MRATPLVLSFLLLGGCGGGDGGGGRLTFAVFSVSPDVSTDLNGGDVVTVTGSNFLAVVIVNVTFGGSPGFNLQVVSDTELRVTTPPAPGGRPGTVTVEVFSLAAGSKLLFNAFTYQGSSSPPNPQTITPTTYTATGAETFTIQGSNLGPPSGSVLVSFAGVGTVTAQVSANSTIVTGRAPVSPGAPPSGSVTVTVTNGSLSGNVPTQVSYAFAPPQTIAAPNQTTLGASLPVALAPGFAVLCVAGADGLWRTADDSLLLVRGPPNVSIGAIAITRASGAQVGFLDAANSVPVALDASTVAVYSVGPDGAPLTADDRVVLVTSVTGAAPAVADHVHPRMTPAPLAKISASRVGFTHAGADGAASTADDALAILHFSGGALQSTTQVPGIGPVDLAPGRANRSIPASADGDAVFVVTRGPDGVAGTEDDGIVRHQISSGLTHFGAAPSMVAAPAVLSANLVACPGVGPSVASATDDDLVVVAFLGGALQTSRHALPSALLAAAPSPFARIGAIGVAVPCAGPDGVANTVPDEVVVYTNPATNAPVSLQVAGLPLLASLGSTELVVFDRGPNTNPNTGDETVRRVNAAASLSNNFANRPGWSQAFAPLTDFDRVFAIGPGADGTLGSGDETLLVFQTRALGAPTDAATLPLALPSAPANPPTLGFELPFVPIGPGWGLLQSPGVPFGLPNPAFGDGNDLLLLVRY